MKKLILATAVTAAVAVYFVGDNNQPVEQENILNQVANTGTSIESTSGSVSQLAAKDTSDNKGISMPSNSSDGQNYSSFNQDYNAIESDRVSNIEYSRYNSEAESYRDDNNSNQFNGSSNEDYESSDGSSSYSSNSSSSEDENKEDSVDSTETDKEELPTEKFQRIYDNGIAWYGDTGSLEINYQSSDPETAGIGFRLHYDNNSMKVVRVTQYTGDAIIITSPQASQADTNNNDGNATTNAFLPFAWASMYAQWPQATQLNLATVEFERLYTGSDNLNIDYSVISNQAGFQFIK